MELTAIMRSLGALAFVLGVLAGGVWAIRRFAPAGLRLTLPRTRSGETAQRLQLLERLALDQRRALLLVRHDAREHLILLSGDQVLCLAAGEGAVAHERRDSIRSAEPVEEAAHA